MNSFIQITSLASRGFINYFRKKPLCVSFEITYRCNARCKHCHLGGQIDKENETATAQRYGEICRELKPVVAQVSGGEPLLRKDLEQILYALKRPKGTPFIILTTNGVLLTKEKYNALREAGVDEFSLSLDYPDDRHDDFRGIPGLFNRIKNLLEEIQSEKHKAIALSCVVQSQNFRNLIELAEFARHWNVKMNFSTYTWLRTNKKEYMIPKEDLSEFKEVIHQLLDYKRKYKTIVTSDYIFKNMVEFFERESFPGCRAGERFLIINPDGSLSPCGLIIKKYDSQKELRQDFLKNNTCTFCYTSIRGNNEKPVKYLLRDSLKAIV